MILTVRLTTKKGSYMTVYDEELVPAFFIRKDLRHRQPYNSGLPTIRK
jgi:hypothetical protein